MVVVRRKYKCKKMENKDARKSALLISESKDKNHLKNLCENSFSILQPERFSGQFYNFAFK